MCLTGTIASPHIHTTHQTPSPTAVLVRVHAYIKTLGYADAPDYEHLQGLLTLTEDEQQAIKATAPPLQTPLLRGGSACTADSAAPSNGVHTTPLAPHHMPTPGQGPAVTPRSGSVASVGGPMARPPLPAQLRPAEPSKAAALAANIMQNSAAARKALEAQRVRLGVSRLGVSR